MLYFYIIGNFLNITYDIKTLREHAHAFAKEECRKNATQKWRANVLCTFFILQKDLYILKYWNFEELNYEELNSEQYELWLERMRYHDFQFWRHLWL